MSKFVKHNPNPNAMMGVPRLFECCPGEYTIVCCDGSNIGPRPILPCSYLLLYQVWKDGLLLTSGQINFYETFIDLATYDSVWGSVNGSLNSTSVYELRFTLLATSQDITIDAVSSTNILSPAYTPVVPVVVTETNFITAMDLSELDLTKNSFEFLIETSCGNLEVFSEFVAV